MLKWPAIYSELVESIMDTATKDNIKTFLNAPLQELIRQANEVRKQHIGNKLELCSILNARSGLCSEDCKFCAQSARHHSDVPSYPLKDKREIVNAAQKAKDIGAVKFGIVTSGNRLTDKELNVIAQAVSEIKDKIGVAVCASLGALEKSQLTLLKEAGLSRYHHNIETSRRFYPSIVSTHSFDERIKTIKFAKQAGLEVCTGGIIGMGETWQDRIDMACTLKDLDVDSVPLNILISIKGTPLESVTPLSADDAVRTICIFRIILKDKTIKIAAGREAIFKDSQLKAFTAGANGMLIGGYLTVKGANLDADYALIEEIKRIWTE
ncbi:MAG: biotin synthase BioB [Phycisphaerae bacterium]|nr:biotin synthase BioB [Phycisphaerae bacterium]